MNWNKLRCSMLPIHSPLARLDWKYEFEMDDSLRVGVSYYYKIYQINIYSKLNYLRTQLLHDFLHCVRTRFNRYHTVSCFLHAASIACQ